MNEHISGGFKTFWRKMSARDRLLGIVLVLVLAVTTVYWPVRSYDFVSLDDNILVYKNKYYRPVTAESFQHFWKEPHEQLYMPLTYTAWAALFQAARVTPSTDSRDKAGSKLSPDLDPNIFHSFNLLLHVLNTLLVFLLIKVLIEKDWAAGAGALLFGLHPIQVESVAWVSEMKGLLGGFFGLLALWLYVCHLKSKAAVSSASLLGASSDAVSLEAAAQDAVAVPQISATTRYILYALAIAAYICALLAKPAAASLPFIALLLDYRLRRSLRGAMISVMPWFVATLPIAWMARVAQPATELFSPLSTRPLVALDALAFYISKIFWPSGLIPDYGRTPKLALDSGWVYWTWVLPVVLGAFLWWKRKQWPFANLGALVLVLGLIPVLGLVPFIYQYYSTVADRYLYLPLLGVALVFSAVLTRWPRGWLLGSAATVVFVMGVLTTRQIPLWQDAETLNRSILHVNPNGWFALNNLSEILQGKGEFAQAAQGYRRAIQLRPDLEESYTSLGFLLYQQGKKTEAIELYLKAVEISPTSVRVYRNLAAAYKSIGQDKYAILALRRLEQLEPDDLQTHLGLADLYFSSRRFAEAQKQLEQAAPLAPNPESFHLTAAVLLTKHKLLTEAIQHYLEALRYRPDNATLHNDLGVTLLRLKKPQQAAKAFANAVKIKPDYFQAHTNLGQALLEQRKANEARSAFKQALKIKPGFAPAASALKTMKP